MNISDEAVEAALGSGGGAVMAIMNEKAMVRRILEAAAPHLMAQALDEAADDYRHYATPNARLYLRERAADLREYRAAGAGE